MNVTYMSACLDSSGYAQAARNHIGALDSVGVKVNVVPVSFEGYRSDLGNLGTLVQSLVSRNPPGDIQILHLTPENYSKAPKAKYTIGYSAWETDKLPPSWVPMINAVDEVWVPSEHNKMVYEKSGITKPIFVMPHPFENDYLAGATKETLVTNIKEEDYVFYSIFQWTERKNAVDLLKAYLTEFTAEENTALILKTYIVNPQNPVESNKIKAMVKEVKSRLHLDSYPKILLISSLLPSSEIKSLHKQSDCYLSLHRCEGFGIPIAEAMLASNPVIVTGYGGPVDFATSQELIPYDLTPVYGMPWNHYKGNMNWAQPRISAAKKSMRDLFSNQKKAKLIGEAGKKEVLSKLSWESMGNKMKTRLEEIESKLNG